MTCDPAPDRRLSPTSIRVLPALACALVLAACSSTQKKPGGYYQGDGPPDRAAADLPDTPDAVPRVEPLHPGANRPYTVLGRDYTPITRDIPFRQRGVASWYGRQFHGNRTASGELYDMHAMTAAHPTLPIPSYVRVTNPRNGRSVIVRVNDRGPFKDGRIIDLSYGAATKLGIVSAGVGEVDVERLTHAQIASGEWRRGAPAASGSVPASASVAVAPRESASLAAPAATSVAGAPRWSVQVGAFPQQASAEELASRVAAVLAFSDGELPPSHREARVERDDNLFRVLVGALPDRATAASLAQQLERLLGRAASPFPR